MAPEADDRNQAEALAIALSVGLATVAEVITWADAVIEREAVPPDWICDVALMRDRHFLDVAGALRGVPGNPDRDAVDALVIARMRAAFDTRPERVVSALYRLWCSRELPDISLDNIAVSAEDELSMARDGVYGSPAEIFADVAAALDHAAAAIAGRGPSA